MSAEDNTMETQESTKGKKRWKTIMVLTMIVVLIGVAVWGIQIVYIKNYDSYRVLSSVKRADGNQVTYLKYGDCLLKYSKDGA